MGEGLLGLWLFIKGDTLANCRRNPAPSTRLWDKFGAQGIWGSGEARDTLIKARLPGRV